MLDLLIVYLMGAMVCFPVVVQDTPENTVREEGVTFYVVDSFIIALVFWWVLPLKLFLRVIRGLLGDPFHSARA